MHDAQQPDADVESKLANRRTRDRFQVWANAVLVCVISAFVCIVFALRRPWHNGVIAIFVVCALWIVLCGWFIPRRSFAARTELSESWLRLGEPGWDQERLRATIRRNAVWAFANLGCLVGGLVVVYLLARAVS